MSVDHGGIAWVVYDNGEMFKVNIKATRSASEPRMSRGDPASAS
jgi:hypothetical protein